MDEVVEAVISAARNRGWDTVRSLFHPYVHWYDPHHDEVRGRNNVLELLQRGNGLVAPSAFELRDGQIYRWWSR